MAIASKNRRKKAPIDNRKMSEINCANKQCSRFLGYQSIEIGLIHIGCRRCKSLTLVSTFPEDIPTPNRLRAFRCANCGRFLFSEAMIAGNVKVKCRGCGEWNTLDIKPESDKLEMEKVE